MSFCAGSGCVEFPERLERLWRPFDEAVITLVQKWIHPILIVVSRLLAGALTSGSCCRNPSAVSLIVLSLLSDILGRDCGPEPVLAGVRRLGEGGVASHLSPNRAPSAHAAAKEIDVEISTLHEESSQNGQCYVFCKWSGNHRKTHVTKTDLNLAKH